MDFTSDSGDFIYAYKSGSSLDSDSTSATITMHDSHDDFSFDFANAKGGSSANPFTSAATTTGSSGANASSTTGSSDSSATTSSSSLGSLSGNSAPFGGDYEKGRNVAIAHGVLAAVAWVILFPFGAISMRLLSFSGLVWFHAAIQIFAYLVFVAAFGLGIYLGLNTYGVSNDRNKSTLQEDVKADETLLVEQSTSHHRNHLIRARLYPAHRRPPASSYVQEDRGPIDLVSRPYLAWSDPHHPRHHQWWSRAPAGQDGL